MSGTLSGRRLALNLLFLSRFYFRNQAVGSSSHVISVDAEPELLFLDWLSSEMWVDTFLVRLIKAAKWGRPQSDLGGDVCLLSQVSV